MGAGPSKLQLKLLPGGGPRQFKIGSKVAVWEIDREQEPDMARVTAVGPKHYDIINERNGEAQNSVPYYILSYPNETRTWGDFFRDGQRVIHRGQPCVLINVDHMGGGEVRLALRSLKTGKIFMHLTPKDVVWDYKFFS